MVVRINQITPLLFKGNNYVTKPNVSDYETNKNSLELNNVSPDYMVKLPVAYKNTGIKEFGNGLKLYSYKMTNGYKVSIIPMPDTPSVVKTYVNVGSMDEEDNIKGISHFLEHMAFNGTDGDNGYKKLNTGDCFKMIDSLGGWCNASTNYAVTDYVNSLPQLNKNDLEEQIKILAAMTENLSLTENMVTKEKGPVTSEIDMILDDPYVVSMDQTVRTLYNIKSSADELVGGSVRHINNLTKEDVRNYYNKFYTPDNINIVVTGDVDPDKTIELIAKNFRNTKHSNILKRPDLTTITETKRKDFITDKTKSAIITLGFSGHLPDNSKDKVIFDILQEYVYSTDLGLYNELFDLDTNFYIGYEKISSNLKNPQMTYIQSSTSEENSEDVINILYDKLSALKSPDEKTLNRIKNMLLMQYNDEIENPSVINTVIGNGVINNNTDYITDYSSILNKITTEDVQNYIDKYLDFNKVALTVVHPQDTEVDVTNAKNISFNGKSTVINKDNIEEITLNNNIDAAFYKTNNDNVHLKMSFDYKIPTDVKTSVALLYDVMHDYGAGGMDENEFNSMLEENNIILNPYCSKATVKIYGKCRPENIDKMFKCINSTLYNPNLTEENLDKAKNKIKEAYKRYEQTSNSLYMENESKTNPYYDSIDEILKNIDNVTLDDIKDYHSYILTNSKCTAVANMPNEDIKNSVIKNLENFDEVQPNIYEEKNIYIPTDKTQILQAARNTSQADITKIVKFKFNDTVENTIKANIIEKLLNNSSIGLFGTLREKEHLAYSVRAKIDILEDCGEVKCNILTTTDNKDTGEKPYENVQKSIDGFNRQINALINSEYTDDDLEMAKKLIKSALLKDTTRQKYSAALSNGITSKHGIDEYNQLYDAVDTITREDIDAYTREIFNNKSVYSIVASEDTLKANEDYFNNLIIAD